MTPPRDSLTPEERLLKAVRGEALAQEPPFPKGMFKGVSAVLAPSQWVRAIHAFSGGQPIRRLNEMFLVLILVAGAYFLYDVTAAPKKIQRSMAMTIIRTDLPEIAGKVAPLAPLEEYLNVVQRRDVFRPAGSAPAGPGGTFPVVVSPTEGLRLVGIAFSDESEVMIDDAPIKKTFFLKKGQKIRNLTVQKITPEAVTLKTESGELVELK